MATTAISTKHSRVPLFRGGDVGGLVYFFIGNLINYIIVIGSLKAINWPDSLIYGRVVPGMSLGLMFGGLYYAFMGWRLSRKNRRAEVTALPSGISTPAMFIYLYGIIYPLHYSGLDAETCWRAAAAACFLGGLIETSGGLIGPAVRRLLPRVAMLGTMAGIGLVWMATDGLFKVYHDPILGMPVLIIALIGLIGGYTFKRHTPMLMVAVVFGIGYAFVLGRVTPDAAHIGLTKPVFDPWSIFGGLKDVLPYIAIIVPVMIYAFIETMDNVESSAAAGDDYNLAEAQVADGLCTVTASLFGGIIPNVVWLGHPGLKKSGAGIGYSWAGGLLFGACALTGVFGWFNSIMPPVIASVTFLWCAMLMLVQAYTDTPRRHGAALAIALVPQLADWAFTYVRDTLGAFGVFIDLGNPNGVLANSSDAVSQKLMHYGVIWNGVAALHAGAVLTSIIWASALAFIIDRRLDKAGLALLAAAALSFFGFIHARQLGLNAAPAYAIGYLEIAAVCLGLNLFKPGIVDAPRRYDYV